MRRLTLLRYARLPNPANIAPPPIPNSSASCSPAVPPPPVDGAAAGYEVAGVVGGEVVGGWVVGGWVVGAAGEAGFVVGVWVGPVVAGDGCPLADSVGE